MTLSRFGRGMVLVLATWLLVLDLFNFPAIGTASPPNFANITFDSLRFQEPGGIDLSSLTTSLGYDPSHSWQAGDTLAKVTQLSDFGGSFPYSLKSIAQASEINLARYRLSDVAPLISGQTIRDIVSAIPSLNYAPIATVPAIAGLLNHYAVTYTRTDTIADLLNDNGLASLYLGAMDLSQFSLAALPGLADTRLDQFPGWQSIHFSNVRGLGSLPIFSLPKSVPFSAQEGPSQDFSIPLMVQADIVFGPTEKKALRPVTGSYNEGFQVPCQQQQGCPHIELTGQCLGGDCRTFGAMISLLGKQWISGRYQTVMGGSGALMGPEPTGRHPALFTEFKLVLTDTNETTGEAVFGLYTHICTPVGCTPYIVGPLPLYRIREKDFLLM